MADNPLEALSLNVLKKIRKDAANAISTYEDPQQATARTKVEAFARDLGYSRVELVGVEAKATTAPAASEYRHAENSALT